MKGKFFLDTNIFVYSFETGEKAELSQRLIERALATGKGYISTQVIQEFLNVALRKFQKPLSHLESQQYLEKVLGPLCYVYPDIQMYRNALDLQKTTKYSFYDSLMIAAALKGNCATLYSEDMQSGQVIQTLTISNPFAFD